jgi:hypothetical protein
MARDRDRRNVEGFLTLSWLLGKVQIDFGEASFVVRGVHQGQSPAVTLQKKR